MTNMSDELAQKCADHMFYNDAATQSMGMSIVKVAEGQSIVSMCITSVMLNGHQTCHGGQLFSLADSAFAFACNSYNEAAVAANCTIDFIRPAFEGDVLKATATVCYQGKRTGIYHVQITNQNNELIALFKGNSARINRKLLPTD
uniref:hydroxyphenylacetyl-CoA thioesterase PaaI n=1 Tax=Ningiella ruwaisensis TaxID=2364274 RepID=UPI0010A038FC|nr:hydroxyphenylacetyl-CoA thioesterase PaaI [Ningiella ruwaisensis]